VCVQAEDLHLASYKYVVHFTIKLWFNVSVCVCVCACVRVSVCVGMGGGVQTVSGYVGEPKGLYHYYTIIELSFLATGTLMVCQPKGVCPLRTHSQMVKNRERF
jgi:hypothetical protein